MRLLFVPLVTAVGTLAYGDAEAAGPAASSRPPSDLKSVLRRLADRSVPMEEKRRLVDQVAAGRKLQDRRLDGDELWLASPDCDSALDHQYQYSVRMLAWVCARGGSAADYLQFLRGRRPLDRPTSEELCNLDPGNSAAWLDMLRLSLQRTKNYRSESFAARALTDGYRESGIPRLLALLAGVEREADRSVVYQALKLMSPAADEVPPFDPAADKPARTAQLVALERWFVAARARDEADLAARRRDWTKATIAFKGAKAVVLFEDLAGSVALQINYLSPLRDDDYLWIRSQMKDPAAVPPFDLTADLETRKRQVVAIKNWWATARPEQEKFFAKRRADFLALREELKVIAELDSDKSVRPDDKKP